MTKPTNFEMVQDFHKVFDNGYKDSEIENTQRVVLRAKLMLEELEEVFYELGVFIVKNETTGKLEVWRKGHFKPDKVKVAKELADLLYVTYGSADTMDIPIDEVYTEVHRSNMSKMHPDGTIRYREDGKILKGEWYSPADIESVFKK